MNVISSPVSAPLPGSADVGAAGASLADGSTGLPFGLLLSENPECTGDRHEDPGAEQPAADGKTPNAIDPTLFGLLAFLPAQVAPPPPPEPATASADSGMSPVDFEPARTAIGCTNGTASGAINTPGNSLTSSRERIASAEEQPAGVAARMPEAPNVAAQEGNSIAAEARSNPQIIQPAGTAPEFASIPRSISLPESRGTADASDVGADARVIDSTTPTPDAISVPHSSSSPDPRGTSDADSPAKFSRVTVEMTREHPPEKTQFPRTQQQTADPRSDGTAVAMERRAMPEVLNEQHLKPTASTAADAFSPRVVAPARLAPVQEKSGEPDRRESAQSSPSPLVTLSGASFPPADRQHDVGPAEFRAAAHCIEQTMDLAERIHAKGSDRVEVQMRLLDGHEVTVSLHLENGEWKPVFKTDTDALCQVLEQSWQQSAAQPASRTVRFGTPVFESLQSHADLSGGMHQRQDARERSFTQREQESFTPTAPARNRAAAVASKTASLAASSGVRLYA